MPFQLVKHPDLDLTFGLGSGAVTHLDMMEAFDRGYESGNIAPGMDRVTVMHPSADLQALDLGRIQLVQKTILHWEAAGDRLMKFRGVFVHSSSQHRVVGALFKASWQAMGEAGAEVSFAGSVGQAVARLGKRNGDLLRAAAMAATSLPNQGDWLR